MNHQYEFNKEFQEFILSFNTTACFGMAIVIFLWMRHHTHLIEEAHVNAVADLTIKFIPKVVLNLIDKILGHDESDELNENEIVQLQIDEQTEDLTKSDTVLHTLAQMPEIESPV